MNIQTGKPVFSQKLSNRLIFLLFIILVRISLDLSYIWVISPKFSYSGFITQIDFVKLFESYVFILFFGLIIPNKIKKPSDCLVIMLFLVTILPTLSLYAMKGEARSYTYMIIMAFSIITVIAMRNNTSIKIVRLKGGQTLAVIFSVFAVLIVTISLISKEGLQYFNLDIERVYEFRRTVSAVINVGIFGYVNTWVFKVFNPALLVWSIYKKRPFLFLTSIGLQVLFFAISSHKSVLFFPLLIILVYLFVEKSHALHYIYIGLLGVIIGTGLLAIYTDLTFPASLLIRRLFYVPAQLNYAYYDFFSNAGHVYLTTSIFSLVLEYPFPYPPPQMISIYLMGNNSCWANTGFLATSYMHFGFFGMIIYSVIVGLLLRIVDMLVVNKLPLRFGLSLVIIPFFSLFTSADLTTALLTHGLLLSLLLLWLFSARRTTINKAVRRGE